MVILFAITSVVFIISFSFWRSQYVHGEKYYYDSFGDKHIHPYYKKRRLSNLFLGGGDEVMNRYDIGIETTGMHSGEWVKYKDAKFEIQNRDKLIEELQQLMSEMVIYSETTGRFPKSVHERSLRLLNGLPKISKNTPNNT